MQKSNTVTLELYRSSAVSTGINYIAGDDNTMHLFVRLRAKGRTFSIPKDAAVELNMENAAGVRFKRMASVVDYSGGLVVYEIGKHDLAAVGTVKTGLSLVIGNKRLSWPIFTFMVQKDLTDSEAVPTDALKPWKADIENRLSGLEDGVKAINSKLDDFFLLLNEGYTLETGEYNELTENILLFDDDTKESLDRIFGGSFTFTIVNES